MVTVSSDSKSPPNVFPMSQCQSSSDSLFIGCLASDSLNLKLKDSGKDLTGIIEYPPVKTGDKTFQVSLLSITKQKMEQSNITCDAENQIGKVSKQFKVNPQEPTLSLVPVITQKNTFAMCVIEDFYPMDITARWKENDVYSQRRTKLEYKRNTEGLFTAHSFYEVSSKTWNEKTRYTCEVTYQGKPITVTKNFKATFALTLNPPIERELFVNNKTVLEAVVSGDVKEMVQAALVSCKVKDENIAKESITSENTDTSSTDTSSFTKKHKVIIDTKKWFDGEYVTCTIHDTNNNRPIEQKIHFDKGDGRKPNATIYRPDDIKADPVSLVCKVTSSNLGNVYIMWKVGDESYKEGRTSAPIRQNDSTSILSILTIPKKAYEKPQTTVTCAVKHANMDKIGSPLQVTTSQSKNTECPLDYSEKS